MSTFLGLIEELPGISVDRFDGENLDSSAYFLSHCHSDHMVGLNEKFFVNLAKYKKCLYCSPLSKALLEGMYRINSSSNIKAISVNTPTIVCYKDRCDDNKTVSITLISAGHCPGSVMFLFEADTDLILYTGDFRINPIDFPKLKYLHFYENSSTSVRQFTKIYLDTTFLDPNFSYLPTRQESVSKICEISKDWLQQNPRNVIVLECSHLYGSECLYIELSKLLNMTVHVKDKVYQNYRRIVELLTHVTNDPDSTRIHACKSKLSRKALNCRYDVQDENVMTIVPSVQRWYGKDTSKVVEWDERDPRILYVCYSTHSSFSELKAFLQYFKSSEIYPCVCPVNTANQVYSLLSKIIKTPVNHAVSECSTYKLELSNFRVLPETSFTSEILSDDDDDL